MKKIILILLGFLVSTAFAQHDPVAKKILDRVANKTNSYKSIKAQFTNTLVNKVEDFSESFEGTIYIKDKNYKLEFMDTETYFNGKTKWVYLKESDEVNVSDVEHSEEDSDEVENEILNDPTKILTIYQEDFKYKYIEDKVVDGITVSVIDLVPESLEKNYSRIRLFINNKKDELYTIKYFSKDGNNYIFKINNMETDLEFDNNFFVFNEKEHPDVEVIDLRE
ncbi:MAG: outer membrane lipoprotein carrier protein LolA [Chlorobi bacterium]|nr:outer membrane lipoprotein carrier protein LolA [Chlorobiota bacterium]